MNIIESKPNSLIALYTQRLSNLSQTLSSLHSKIQNDPSLLLLQTHPVLQKYQTDRINQLVKEIIDDQRESTLVSCLQAYHKVQSQLDVQSLIKSRKQENKLFSKQTQQQFEQLKRRDLERIEISYQLDEARCQIKMLKEQLSNKELTKSFVERDFKVSVDFQKSNLQNLVHSLTIQNRRLRQQNDKIKEYQYNQKKVQQRFGKDNQYLKQQIRKLKLELDSKNQHLMESKRQISEYQNESNNRIQLSQKYSHLTQYKRSQFIHQAGNLLQLPPKNKFRVAQFQELCYQMNKQQQQLKLIRINFRKFKQIVQTGIKNHLQSVRKVMIAMKSKVQSQLEDSQRQLQRFLQLFEGKASKILAYQRVIQNQKVQDMKRQYETKISILQQKNKAYQIEQKKIASQVQIKIKDERIQQLENQISSTKQLEIQYKELLTINQDLKRKYNDLNASNRQSAIQSPQRLTLSPPPINNISYVEVTPRLQNSSNILRSSKSLSPKTPNNILPLSPSQYGFKLNIPYSKSNYNLNQIRYNPQTYLDQPTSDSRNRRQLESGFNELEQQIQAIIERRSKRNARNTFGY